MRKEKLCKPVKVPEALTLEGQNFRLNGVIVHAGRSSNAGHYYTIAKTGSGPRWNLCNDSSVSELGKDGSTFDIASYINRSIGGAFASDTPYMLSYERVPSAAGSEQKRGDEDQEMTDENANKTEAEMDQISEERLEGRELECSKATVDPTHQETVIDHNVLVPTL